MYIDELTELISVSIAADMNSLSVKPDKCAVLHETVKQTRKILEQEESGCSSGTLSGGEDPQPRTPSHHLNSGGGVALAIAASDDGLAGVHHHGPAGLQPGDMLPSKPALLDTQMVGAFLLEALDGFLFVVNTEGKTEYVSDNVTHFLRYQPQDLVGKSIYNIIHHGDHARFSSSLLPTTIGKTGSPIFTFSLN